MNTKSRKDITTELEPTTQAIHAVDEAHLHHVHDDALWERRGILQRLTRVDSEARTQTITARRLTPARAGAAPGN